MVLTSCLCLALPCLAQESKTEPVYDMKLRQLVFLVEPEVAPAISKEEAVAKQRAHLAYLEGLWKAGKLLLVGPLVGAGKLKGICLVDVEKPEEAEALLKQDPWVAAGQLKIELKTWFVARNVPQQGPKFLDLEPLWFGFLKRPADAPEYPKEVLDEIQAGHMTNIGAMAASGDLVLAGPMAGNGELRGIFIFRTASKEKVMEMAAKDPAIQKGRLKLELFQWFTAKGTFPM